MGVITNTHADYLIVIGDRNMKNDTCQAQRSGKLIEMKVEDRIRDILLNWGDSTGLRPASERANVESAVEVSKMSDDELMSRVQRYTNVGRVKDRARTIRSSVNELTELKRPRKQGGMAMSYGDQDPETVKKMTVSHTSAIRLHQEIVEAQEAIRNLPCECARAAFACFLSCG